ncbi:MAG: aminomethyl-transferring glycine dehydrogenase subunit GcvPB [Candidatus Margulisbacteria bacterium]|nr:aminomethyl-transferring glycine dehydrogenase subunit GcvPB [Candidatus Margulisiibacteriota bacterium]
MSDNFKPVFYKTPIGGSLVNDPNVPQPLLRKKPLRFPDLSEVEVVRHYTYLSTLNFGVDSGFYPLGSCTMKYNPKILEKIASLEEFSQLHPLQDNEDVQGMLEALYKINELLCAIFGYAQFTLQPAAGAHGEHTGLLIIKAYFLDKGQADRNTVIIPDTAHGTNPASAAIAGFDVVKISTDEQGNINLEELSQAVTKYKVAALMLTNPSTLGLFETQIVEIADIVHKAGGLLYYDGANANALLGLIRPADMGFDVCHLNLHKTFATPHGGGGPGSGPVGVKDFLVQFLPRPIVKKSDNSFSLDFSSQKSIGKVHGFYGNIAIVLRALVYILLEGSTGLRKVSEQAIINANYLRVGLKDLLKLPYARFCMHEFVLSAAKLKKEKGVSALDIAKRLIDFGIHPPTIYFPLIVHECLMIEPTETESKESMDRFMQVMEQIIKEAETTPELLKSAPQNRIVGRLDETKAVKQPKLTAFDIGS